VGPRDVLDAVVNRKIPRLAVSILKGFIYLYIPCLRAMIAQSVLRWATGWTIGVRGFDSRLGLGIFLFTGASRNGSGAHPTSYAMGTRALSLGIKWLGREVDHSPPSTAEVKK
jgi:hypothetical protein